MSTSHHSELLHQAKLNQVKDLKNSSIYSKQLIQILQSLIKSNSLSTSSDLIDKMTTIHLLNDDIDKQLNRDISANYYELMKTKRKLQELISICSMQINKIDKHEQVDHQRGLQERCELIDQDLRILENTLKLIKK
ncbi:hypothetical protein G210_2080 [Candida maltosa Xu316]|uniref:Uncharacterized protein n=1 Tax=Candida maltosa (strain Xu316) TaxID=1245528 RepID=M3K705_CANMX|nr:hypothetical protein G210_2080 [Candida maltosa Xu316]